MKSFASFSLGVLIYYLTKSENLGSSVTFLCWRIIHSLEYRKKRIPEIVNELPSPLKLRKPMENFTTNIFFANDEIA